MQLENTGEFVEFEGGSADGFMEFDTGGESAKILKEARVEIPMSLADIMLKIRGMIRDPNAEYLLFLKGRWDPDACAVVVDTDEFFMPKQVATPGSVRSLEDPPSEEWNVAIHRHPNGYRQFSGTDDKDINQNFLASLLYIPPNEFPAAIVNVPLGGGDTLNKLQVPAKIYLHGGNEENEAMRAMVLAKHGAPPRPPAARAQPGSDRRFMGAGRAFAGIALGRDRSTEGQMAGERDFSEGGIPDDPNFDLAEGESFLFAEEGAQQQEQRGPIRGLRRLRARSASAPPEEPAAEPQESGIVHSWPEGVD